LMCCGCAQSSPQMPCGPTPLKPILIEKLTKVDDPLEARLDQFLTTIGVLEEITDTHTATIKRLEAVIDSMQVAEEERGRRHLNAVESLDRRIVALKRTVAMAEGVDG